MESLKNRLPLWITENVYVRSIFLRITISLLLAFYVLLGAATFLVFGVEQSYVSDLRARRNDTATLLVAELGIVRPTQEDWVRTVTRYLEDYEGEVLRQNRLHQATESTWTFEDAFYFSVSILSTTGSCSYFPRSTATKVAVVIYACFGIPLLAFWLVLHGKTVAQTFLLVCSNFCCSPLRPNTKFKRNSTIQPLPDDINPEHTATPANSTSDSGSRMLTSSETLPAESCLRTITVGTARGTTMVIDRRQILCSLLALILFFSVYALFGAATAAAIWRQPILECVYWGFLQFSTMSFMTSQPHVSEITSEARAVWVAYFGFATILFFAAMYLSYLLLTWKCWFCKIRSDGDMF
ncbi:TWiK family of potassium channels protein 7-like [Ornithodoros turicata]|uniref:TWiK family of potassium channels protein 7-like n=1 Tax=Ornithodoros turicata TaxID=34597 RepID=UPI00313992FE